MAVLLRRCRVGHRLVDRPRARVRRGPHLVSGRWSGLRCRGGRRGGGVPEERDGGARAGQHHHRGPSPRHPLLHAVRFRPGVPHRRGAGGDTAAGASHLRPTVAVEQGDVRPAHAVGLRHLHRRGIVGTTSPSRPRPRAGCRCHSPVGPVARRAPRRADRRRGRGRRRTYPADPLQGRDNAGPIFPLGPKSRT